MAKPPATQGAKRTTSSAELARAWLRRPLTVILLFLLLLLQYPLWLGKGSWMKVWQLNRELEAQTQVNQKTQERNAVLDAEVRDLKEGTEAIEESARTDLGMVRKGETFYQYLDTAPPPAPPAAAANKDSPSGKD